jgi:hypothetical protein
LSRGKVWNSAKAVLFTLAIALVILAITLIANHGSLSSADEATTRNEPKACTEIGCTSGLTADLSVIRNAVPKGGTVKICLRHDCRVVKRSNLGLVDIQAEDLVTGELASVKLVIRNRKGKLKSKSLMNYEVQEVQPNGEGCPPICHQVQIKLGAGGLLRPA